MDLPQPILAHLLELYSDPSRHYHDWRHVQFCLQEFSRVRHECTHPDDVELAIYFHDAIYDPTRHDNEDASAALAVELLSPHLPRERVDHVRPLILATRHDHAPADPDACVLCDADLSILGQPPETFDAYDRAIRLEYAHVADAAFAAGRSAILRSFLGRPRIYHTGSFHDRYDGPARRNLARALERWSGGANPGA